MPETQLESRTPKLETDLKDLAQDMVRRICEPVLGGDKKIKICLNSKYYTFADLKSRLQ